MEVVELTPEREEAYGRFLRACPTALFYHSLRFRDFLVRLLGCEQHYGIALRGADVVGALPLMATEGPYGRVLNSLPYFGSNGGLLGTDPEAWALLRDWYASQHRAPGVAAATVIANPLDPGSSPAGDFDLEDTRVGHITPLEGDEPPSELVLRVINGSARRNVQKAVRSGVEIDVGDDGVDILERLHRENMAAMGGRAKTPAFFRLAPEHFRRGHDYEIYVARVEGEAVAALLVFFFGGTVEYYIPATDVEFRPIQPMAAILHRAMADAAGRGFRQWNWGGSWPGQDSLIRFKAKWGGVPHAYRYTTHLHAGDLLSDSPEHLLDSYPGFYVVPFSALTAATSSG